MPLANCSGDRPRAIGHRAGATTTRRRGFHADRCRSVPGTVRAWRDLRNGDNVRMRVPPGVEPARRGPTGVQHCETSGRTTDPGGAWKTVESQNRGPRRSPTRRSMRADDTRCPWRHRDPHRESRVDLGSTVRDSRRARYRPGERASGWVCVCRTSGTPWFVGRTTGYRGIYIKSLSRM